MIYPITHNITNNNKTNTTFKSTFPVVHWVAESNGSYYPVLGVDLTKKLQRKFVSMLNKKQSCKNIKSQDLVNRLKNYIKLCDKDFRIESKIRSFYDCESKNNNEYKAIAYAITGGDVNLFENELGKNIGKAKGNSINLIGTPYSAETQLAINSYNKNGYKFVQDKYKKIYDMSGIPCSLHTKFEIQRNNNGKIIDYTFVDAKFLPDFGTNNPFEKLGLKNK